MQGTDPLGPPASEVAFSGSQQVNMKSHLLDYCIFLSVHCCCCYCFVEDEKWKLISDVQIADDVCGYYLWDL
jgi:hypothetical protein